MGICFSVKQSATDDINLLRIYQGNTELPYPNQNIIQNGYGARHSSYHSFPLEHVAAHYPTDESDLIISETGDSLSNMPYDRSTTPTSGIRARCYIQPPDMVVIGNRPASGHVGDVRQPSEARHSLSTSSQLQTESRLSSNSALHGLQLGAVIPTNSSASANASICYGNSNHQNDPDLVAAWRQSPI